MGGPAGGSGASGGTDRRAFLYGRGANYTGNDNNDTLTVSGTVEGSVGGWYRVSGDAANGSVTAENKTKIINGNIFGGYTHDGNASGNTAALTGTWVKGGPDGDYSTGAVFGGYTDRGSAKGNTLTINEYSTIDFQARLMTAARITTRSVSIRPSSAAIPVTCRRKRSLRRPMR